MTRSESLAVSGRNWFCGQSRWLCFFICVTLLFTTIPILRRNNPYMRASYIMRLLFKLGGVYETPTVCIDSLRVGSSRSGNARVGANAFVSATCATATDATGCAASVVRPATQQPGGADRSLSRSAAGSNAGCQHLSARGRGSKPVVAAEQEPPRPGAHGCRKAATLGSQRASAGGRPGCAGNAKPGYSLDYRPWQRLPRPTGRRDECSPADANPGSSQRQAFFYAPAGGYE